MHRVLYLGQKLIGEKCFEILRRSEGQAFRICAVVSNDSDDVWWQSNLVFLQCKREDIPIVSNNTQNNNAIASFIDNYEINLILCVQHPWILPPEILSRVNYHAFNLHNAKLPDHQGHNCCNHAILNGDRYYTSTIHRMADTVDMGDIAFERTFEIQPTETARGLYEKALAAGEDVFQQLIECLLKDNPVPRKLVKGKGNYYTRNSLVEIREIMNIHDTQEVDRKARGLYFPPFEPAYYSLAGKKHYILPREFYRFAHEFKDLTSRDGISS